MASFRFRCMWNARASGVLGYMASAGASAALRYRAFVTGDTIAARPLAPGQVSAARMSNIDAVNALITAINFDRFAEIEARHSPDVTFSSFRGPDAARAASASRTGSGRSCAITPTATTPNWSTSRTARRSRCAATIEAKGYDWRPFTQRVIEVFAFEAGRVRERRLYGMLPDLELDKPATAAMNAALEFRGGSATPDQEVAARTSTPRSWRVTPRARLRSSTTRRC